MESYYFIIIFLVLGIVLGSFFNVVGLRMPLQTSFVTGRSSCPACMKSLRWYELIPIISYLYQRGQCTNCHVRLSRVYPYIEGVTGLLFVMSYLHHGLSPSIIFALLFISFSMIIVVTDIMYLVVPNKLLSIFFLLFIFIRMFYPLHSFYDALIGSLIGFLLIALIIIVSKGGMGAGDMKLLAVLGLVVGAKNVLLTFFLAVCSGAIFGLLYMYQSNSNSSNKIPFAPFLILGAIISYFHGEYLLELYLSTLR